MIHLLVVVLIGAVVVGVVARVFFALLRLISWFDHPAPPACRS